MPKGAVGYVGPRPVRVCPKASGLVKSPEVKHASQNRAIEENPRVNIPYPNKILHVLSIALLKPDFEHTKSLIFLGLPERPGVVVKVAMDTLGGNRSKSVAVKPDWSRFRPSEGKVQLSTLPIFINQA